MRAKLRPNMVEYAKYGFGAHIWARQKWSSGVSQKRSCKMHFRRIELVSIRPPRQKFWPNPMFGWFPHCNYNVKQKSADDFCFLVYRFETFCGVSIHHWRLWSKNNSKIKKKFFWDSLLYTMDFWVIKRKWKCSPTCQTSSPHNQTPWPEPHTDVEMFSAPGNVIWRSQ